jgi:KDO2-lipid IV(A) lauroyltransferase
VNFIKSLLEYIIYLVISVPLAILPLSVSVRAGQVLGAVAYHVWGSRRKIALENVRGAIERGVLPGVTDAEELVKKNFRHMGRCVAEINKLNYGLADNLVKNMEFRDAENFTNASAKGKGIVLVAGHTGNWELMFACSYFLDRKFYGVVRKQRNPFIDRMIVKSRKRYGSEIVYKQGAIRTFFKALKAGDAVGVAVDQGVQAEGIRIDFLGAPAWTTRMPSILSKRLGSAVVPIFNYRKDDGNFVMYPLPEVEMTGDEYEDMRRINATVEDYIREHPDQWLWIHRRWKHEVKEDPANIKPESSD